MGSAISKKAGVRILRTAHSLADLDVNVPDTRAEVLQLSTDGISEGEGACVEKEF